MREVAWHMADFLAKSGVMTGVVDYAELFASMAGEFVDLRGAGEPSEPRSRARNRLSGRKRRRGRRAGARAERRDLSLCPRPGRNLRRRAAAECGPIGRAGRGLSFHLVGRSRTGSDADFGLERAAKKWEPVFRKEARGIKNESDFAVPRGMQSRSSDRREARAAPGRRRRRRAGPENHSPSRNAGLRPSCG